MGDLKKNAKKNFKLPQLLKKFFFQHFGDQQGLFLQRQCRWDQFMINLRKNNSKRNDAVSLYDWVIEEKLRGTQNTRISQWFQSYFEVFWKQLLSINFWVMIFISSKFKTKSNFVVLSWIFSIWIFLKTQGVMYLFWSPR